MRPVRKRQEASFKLYAAFFFLSVFLCFPAFSWAQATEENSCVKCHEDSWQEVQGSIHGQQGILCNRCHGGDPAKADKESAKAAGTGYMGIPDKKQIVQVCGSCHADVETMNFYGIRTDQLARYKTSQHGKKLLIEGDDKVAACADCHGSHQVAAVTEPNSPVYPSNIPATCNRCHGKKKIMDAYHLPSDIFDTYKASVHGKALLEKGDLAAAQCASCHGSHGAVPPGVKEVGETCGKCHLNEKKYFLESVHARISSAENFSECISCHGNHGVGRPGRALYQTACVKCHRPESEPMRQALQLQRLFRQAEEAGAAAEEQIKQASIDGLFVENEAALLEQIKSNLIAMGPLQHTLSAQKVSELNRKVVETADRVRADIREKRADLKWRKFALIGIWIFILAMAVALWLQYKRLARHQNGEGGKR